MSCKEHVVVLAPVFVDASMQFQEITPNINTIFIFILNVESCTHYSESLGSTTQTTFLVDNIDNMIHI